MSYEDPSRGEDILALRARMDQLEAEIAEATAAGREWQLLGRIPEWFEAARIVRLDLSLSSDELRRIQQAGIGYVHQYNDLAPTLPNTPAAGAEQAEAGLFDATFGWPMTAGLEDITQPIVGDDEPRQGPLSPGDAPTDPGTYRG